MKKILKYIWLVLFGISAIISLICAADTSGESAFDFVIFIFHIITLIFGFTTFISFYLAYKRDKIKTNLIFTLLPILLVVLISLVQYSSYKTINKKYFMHFYNTSDSNRNYHYYFRVDSTVKAVGQYFMGTGYHYSSFQMIGNLIIIKNKHTDGFKYNRYALLKDTILEENRRILLPVNSYGEPLDTLTRIIEILPSDYDY